MITRIWHGRTSNEKADEYLQFLRNSGTKDYLKTNGNLSVKVLQSRTNDCCHFWTISEWIDIDAVKSFAGDHPELAVYYPEDEGFLLEFEKEVIHAETFQIINRTRNL